MSVSPVEFSSFASLPEIVDPPKLTGMMTILWVSVYTHNVHNDSGPYIGLCKYDGRSMLFFAHDTQAAYSQSVYNIYDLSETARAVVEADHLKYQETVGNSRDYGPARRIHSTGDFGGQVMHKCSYDIGKLEVNYLGQLAYDQIENKYPHSPAPSLEAVPTSSS